MNFSPAVQHGLIQTAKDAAALLMQYYKTSLGSGTMYPCSAANALIMQALKALTPHIPVIAEESAETQAGGLSRFLYRI